MKNCCALAQIVRYKPQAVIYKDDIGRLNDVFIVLSGQCLIAQRLLMKVSTVAIAVYIRYWVWMLFVVNVCFSIEPRQKWRTALENSNWLTLSRLNRHRGSLLNVFIRLLMSLDRIEMPIAHWQPASGNRIVNRRIRSQLVREIWQFAWWRLVSIMSGAFLGWASKWKIVWF